MGYREPGESLRERLWILGCCTGSFSYQEGLKKKKTGTAFITCSRHFPDSVRSRWTWSFMAAVKTSGTLNEKCSLCIQQGGHAQFMLTLFFPQYSGLPRVQLVSAGTDVVTSTSPIGPARTVFVSSWIPASNLTPQEPCTRTKAIMVQHLNTQSIFQASL